MSRACSFVLALAIWQTCISLPVAAKTKDIKIRGYVTRVTSPTNFEIEDYRITSDQGYSLEFESASPELNFKKEDIRVGVELEIRGPYNDQTGELQAKSVKVDLEQFKKLKRSAILSRVPEGLQKTGEGWSGTFFADGQRIRVTPQTQVLFKLTGHEKKMVKDQQDGNKKDEEDIAGTFHPLSSLAEVSIGMFMTYEGQRDKVDGTVVAERVEFSHNDFEKGEQRLWNRLEAKVKPWDARQFKPGELKIKELGKYKLVPNEEVQNYVSQIGQSLVPRYYANLAQGDPSKIRFRFYVVDVKGPPNAFALANGIVLIHSSMLMVLENEAQLAAVLGHEIEHSVQEHTWRQMQYHKKKLMALQIGGAVATGLGYKEIGDVATLIVAAVKNGYSRSLENQADRLGLERMVEAGYDPREAPAVWKAMTKKQLGSASTDFFWSRHDNNATRRSYLMCELKNNYSRLDYSTLRTGDETFNQIAQLVQSPRSKVKIKVKSSPSTTQQALVKSEPYRSSAAAPSAASPSVDLHRAAESGIPTGAPERTAIPKAEPQDTFVPVNEPIQSHLENTKTLDQPNEGHVEQGYADCGSELKRIPVISSPRGIKALKCGERVSILSLHDNWMRIRTTDNQEGYVAVRFISEAPISEQKRQ